MRKPRSDSKLLNLPDERKSEILDLLDTPGVSLKDARAALARDFGIQSSPASLSHFYSQEKAKRVIARRVESLSVASQIAAEANSRPEQFTRAMTEQIAQIAFELSINPNSSPKDIKTFFDMVLKAGEQDISRRRVALLEQKATQAKETLGDSKLSDAERVQRMKQIFGAA
jgi:hypothetical protein